MNLPAQFKEYLLSQENPTSKVTIKNYIADVNKFIRWFEVKFLKDFAPEDVTGKILETFKAESLNSYSASSVDRNLSSLRKFFVFLKAKSEIVHSPFEQSKAESENAAAKSDPWKIKDFKNNLYVLNASHLTIKNYVIDVKQFLSWAETVLGQNDDSWQVNDFDVASRIDSKLIEEYKTRLLDQMHLSPVSVNRKLSSLRRYLSWAKEEGIIKDHAQVPNIQAQSINPENFAKKAEAVATPFAYSKFPPLRLIQKTKGGALGMFDELFTYPFASLLEKGEYAFWKLKGKPVTLSNSQSFIGKFLKREAQKELRIKNIKKEFYAPALVSTRYYPLHRKVWHHARNTRPDWYRKYHNNSIVSYFHFAILVIFMSALGYGLFSYINPDKQLPTFASVPTAPPRILSFQGRLTDNSNNPITSTTALRMAIYDSPSASGSSLLWQEIVSPTPDSDGIFSTLLGNNTVIPQSVFAEHSALYLGVTVGQTPELTPRQQLATVAYATNAETLQGLEPITNSANTSNVVLALNSSGNLSIGGSATPTFSATGGTFTLQGTALVLSTTTGSGGNVQIKPDGLGKVDISKPILNTSNNNNIATAVGAVEVNDLFAILATSSGQSAFTLNQDSTGPLISASASGIAKFTVTNAGNLTAAGTINGLTVTSGTISSGTWNGTAISSTYGGTGINTSSSTGVPYITGGTWSVDTNQLSVAHGGTGLGTYAVGDLIYASGTTTLGRLAVGSATQCLLGGTTPAWGTCATGTTFSPFQISSGAIVPLNSTLDFLIGSQATTSAKFAVLNVNGSGPATASVSGNFIVMPNNGAGGLLGVGNTNPLTRLEVGANTATDEYLTVRSKGTAGIELLGDTDNDGSELGTAYIMLSQDGTVNQGIFGLSQSNGVDAKGATYTNTLANGVLFGTYGNAILQFGTASILRAAYRLDGSYGLGTNDPKSQFQVTRPLVWGALGTSLAVFDQIENQDIIAASKSGVRKFVVDQNGNVALAGSIASSSNYITAPNFTLTTGGNLDTAGTLTAGTADAFSVAATGDITTVTNETINGIDINAGAVSDITTLGASSTITFSTFSTNGGLIYTNGSGVLTQLTSQGSNGDCLLSGGAGAAPSFGGCPGGSGSNFWRIGSGALSPYNDTLDLLIGGNATTSAKFGVLNINSGTPTASISANSNSNATYLTGDGTLGTVKRSSLTIGNSSTYNTTGNLLFNPNGQGNIGIGTTDPLSQLHVNSASAKGTIDLTGASGGDFRIAQGPAIASGYVSLTYTSPKLGLTRSGTHFLWYDTSIGDVVLNNTFGGASNLKLQYGGANVVDIASSLNVGIGTTAPDKKLEINSASGANLRLTYNDSDGSASNYTDFSLASDGDLTIDSAGGNILFANADTLNVGGAAATAYNFFADSTAGNANAAGDNDLYVQDVLEVDGTIYGNVTGNLTGTASDLACSTCVSLTTEVSGVLPLANGGTNKNLSVVQGGLLWTDSDSVEVSAAGTTGQALISGGTGAPTWFAPTAGSVLFAGTSGILQQDNASFFFDDSNNRLGLGTATPTMTLDVRGNATHSGTLSVITSLTGLTTGPIATIAGRTNNAALVVDNEAQGVGSDLFTASSAGTMKFLVDKSGFLTIGGAAINSSNYITATNFSVANTGAVTAVGVNSGSGLIQGSGGLTISAGTTAITGTTNINTSGSSTTTIGAGSGTDLALNDANWSVTGAGAATFASGTFNGNVDMTDDLILNIGNSGTDFTAGGGLTLAGTLTANGVIALGDNGDNFSIDSNAFDVTTAGAVSGVTTLSMSGVLTNTVSTGTAPFTISSTTKVTNLNADLLDGIDSTGFCQTGGTGCPAGTNYFTRTSGNIYPTTVNDTLSATSSADTVATHTSNGTMTNNTLINAKTAGTVTNLLNLSQEAGSTVTNGLTFTGTFTKLINSTSFNVTNAGAVTAGTYNGNTITTGTGVLTLGASKTLTVNGTTTLADNSITLGGGEVITFSASNALSLLTTGTTSVTLPTSGTLYGTATGSITSNQLLTSLSDETGTGVTVFGTSPAITTSLTTGSSSFDLLNTTATTVNFAGGATTKLGLGSSTANTVNVPSLSASSAVYTDGSKNLTSTAPATGTIGYWSRSAQNVLSPATLNDVIAATSSAYTVATHTTNGTVTSNTLINAKTAGTTTNLLNLSQETGSTVTNGLTFSGTFTKLINSTNFNVTNAGGVTAVGLDSGSGLITGSGGLTISAGTTAITGTTNINTSGSSTTTIGAVTGTDLALNDANWSITGAGVAAFGSVLQVGGTTATTYSRLGTATAGGANIGAANDLLISDALEVDGLIYADGGIIGNVTGNLTGTASDLACSTCVSLTTEVSGVLPIANGGTNKNLTLSNGGIVWSDSDSFEILSANANSGLALVSGGAGTPSWFAPTLGSVLFAGTNGALTQDNASFFFDDSNNRLGLGTTTPKMTLDVNGSATISGTLAVQTSHVNFINGPVATISGKTNTAALVVNNSGGGDLFTASSSGLSRFVIAQNGNVGIGTRIPTHRLHVAGENQGYIKFGNSPGSAYDQLLILSKDVGPSFGGDASFGLNPEEGGNITVGGTSFVVAQGSIDFTSANASQIVKIINGNLQIGSGTPTVSLNGEDAYITGTFETDGAVRFDSSSITLGNGAFTTCSALETVAGVLTCGTDDTGGGSGSSNWNIVSGNGVSTGGYISPINDTADLLIGGNATSSAKFAVINLNSGTPLASVAGTLNVSASMTGLTTGPIATIAGRTNNAALVVDNEAVSLSSDLLTASSAGVTKFTIDKNGNLGIAGSTVSSSNYITAANFNVTTGGVGTFAGGTFNGNVDMTDDLILNIGNSGTDFTAGGGLNLAGTFDSNGDVSIADTNIAFDGASTTFTTTGTGSLFSTGDITLDSTTDINLDADGADILFKDGGTTFATFTNTSTDLTIVPAGGDVFVTGNIDASGTLKAGTADAFSVDASGNTTISGTTGLTFSSTGGIAFAGGVLSDSSDGVDINDDLDISGLLNQNGGDGSQFAGAVTFNDDATYTLAGTEALTVNNTTQGAADLVSINPTWTANNAADALSITTTSNYAAAAGVQYGLNLTNADNGGNTGLIDALALFSNDQATETLPDGIILRHNVGSGTLTDGLQIENTTAGGTITNAINILETAGTITTGINIGTVTTAIAVGTVTTVLDSANLDISNAGAISGATGIASTGTIAFSGAGTFSIDSSAFDVSSGGALSGITGYTQASGAFSSTGTTVAFTTTSTNTLTLADNITDAFDLQEGTNNYINLNTTNSSENLSFGNATTNPTFKFLGSGLLTLSGNATSSGTLSVQTSHTSFITGAVATISGKTNFAALVVNNNGLGSAFTASVAGNTVFEIQNDGSARVAVGILANASNGLCHTGGVLNGGLTDNVMRTLVVCSGSPSDIAEVYPSNADTNPGDLLTLVSDSSLGANKYRAVKATNAYDPNIIGIVSTIPTGPNGKPMGHGTIPESDNPRAIGLTGRVPIKVSLENGTIEVNDYLTSSSVPGVAMKATKAGIIIGKALERYDGSVRVSEGTRFQETKARELENHFNPDPVDPNNPIGKVLVYTTGPSFVDPDVQITNSGDISLTPTVDNNFEVKRGGENVSRIGAYAEIVAAKIKAGLISAQDITTNTLAVATDSITIAGQSLHDYIASIVDQKISENNNSGSASTIVSPVIEDGDKIAIKLKDNSDSKFEIRNASNSAVASIDANGNASFSGKLTANGVESTDASFSGTIRAKKIIADEIEGLNIKAATVSANYITNNYYNLATPSGLTQPATQSAQATGSAMLDNLTALTATFTQGLMSYGPSSFFEASVSDRLFVGSQLSLADNSINVLGSNLELQPLKQGGVSFLGGLMEIDAEGNVRVDGNASFAKEVEIKGRLAANVIAPIPGKDLVFELPEASESSIQFRTGSGSAMLSINNKGDLSASGAGTFGKLNLSFVGQAQALSSTEVAASSSAGIAEINANQTELTIRNALVTENSLIYITPRTSTPNQSVYLMRQFAEDPQTSGVEGSFTVGISQTINKKVPFNWFIIN